MHECFVLGHACLGGARAWCHQLLGSRAQAAPQPVLVSGRLLCAGAALRCCATMLQRVLLFALLPLAAGRHAILPENEPALTDKMDWTVDTASTAVLYSPRDTAKLFVTLRSPTTQLVAFSPDRMPIDASKLSSPSENRTIYKLLLIQRACKMASGSTKAESCYETPFDYRRPDSPDRVFEFYRYGGTGGADPNDVLMMEASAAMPNGTELPKQWRQRGFRGCPELERTCNNHRAVSMQSGNPATLRRFRRQDWSNVYYNDAEVRAARVPSPSPPPPPLSPLAGRRGSPCPSRTPRAARPEPPRGCGVARRPRPRLRPPHCPRPVLLDALAWPVYGEPHLLEPVPKELHRRGRGHALQAHRRLVPVGAAVD